MPSILKSSFFSWICMRIAGAFGAGVRGVGASAMGPIVCGGARARATLCKAEPPG
jgi:hypothetical protein